MRVVDATARRRGFTFDTAETERRHNEGERSFRRYYRGSVVLFADITPHLTFIYLVRGGVIKTPNFIATEEELTASLLRINPNIVIVTGYVVNPMM